MNSFCHGSQAACAPPCAKIGCCINQPRFFFKYEASALGGITHVMSSFPLVHYRAPSFVPAALVLGPF